MLSCTQNDGLASDCPDQLDGSIQPRRLPQATIRYLLVPGKLLRGNRSGCAILVRILQLGPQRPRLGLLARRGIQIGQIKLRHSRL